MAGGAPGQGPAATTAPYRLQTQVVVAWPRMDRLRTVVELAALLGTTPNGVYMRLKRHSQSVPPPIQLPGSSSLRWRQPDVEVWLVALPVRTTGRKLPRARASKAPVLSGEAAIWENTRAVNPTARTAPAGARGLAAEEPPRRRRAEAGRPEPLFPSVSLVVVAMEGLEAHECVFSHHDRAVGLR